MPESIADLMAEEQGSSPPVESPPVEAPPEAPSVEEPSSPAPPVETPPEPPPVEGPEDDEQAFLAWAQELAGDEGPDLSKYKSPEELLKGLVHAAKHVGKRDEDAQFGRMLRERLAGREQELYAFLNGEQRPTEPEPKPSSNGVPEYDPSWKQQITRDDEGNLVPVPGAPADVVQKYLRWEQWKQQRLENFARDPESVIADVIAKAKADVLAEVQGLSQQQLQQIERNNTAQVWYDANKVHLHPDGDAERGWTPLGEEFRKEYDRLVQLVDWTKAAPAELAAYALQVARSRQPQVKRPRALPKGAQHRPAVAAKPAQEKTILEKIDELELGKPTSKGQFAALLAEEARKNRDQE